MRKVEILEESNPNNDRARLACMSKTELEPVVIEAIREHRCLMESDQVVFEEWENARSDPGIPFEHVERLEAECIVRRKKTMAQQDALSDMLDLLGYVPKIPGDCLEDITPAEAALDPLR